jgi:type IV secretory pathway protease TraF
MWHDHDADMITTLLDLGADALEAVVLYCNNSATADQSTESLIAQQEHDRGYTPLHAAIVKRKGEAESIDMLRVSLTSKDSHLAAALVKQDRTGRTILHLAVKLRLMELGYQYQFCCYCS